MRRKTFDAILAAGGLLLVGMLLVAGGLMTWGHGFVSSQVHSQLAAGLMLLLSLLGIRHARRPPADADVHVPGWHPEASTI